MKNNWKRMLSLLLVLVMLAGMFPTSALAVDETVTVTFVCDETVPNVTVYDADGDVISSGRGDHHLAPGSYYYSADADGYEPHVMRPFVIPEDNGAYQGLYITMTPKEQEPEVQERVVEGLMGIFKDPNMHIDVEWVDDIPSDPNGKLRVIVSKVKPA